MYEANKKMLVGVCFVLHAVMVNGQTITQQLEVAFQKFQSDTQLNHATISLYVTETSGVVVYEKNSQIGLAPASTQKIFTAAAAYELLGRSYRYKTYIGYDIGFRNHQLLGNLYIEGNGDPTLGSFRWKSTRDTAVLEKITGALQRHGIGRINGDVWIDDVKFGINPVPGGWTWEDLGNYYGAGSWGFNWRENQYDLIFRPSVTVGGFAEFSGTRPKMYDLKLDSWIKTGPRGSGDNGYVYTAPYSKDGFVTGTIPQENIEFSISGSMPQPSYQFGRELLSFIRSRDIHINGQLKLYTDSVKRKSTVRKAMLYMDSIISPPMDSIIYYFLQKSINLYGETLLNTISKENFSIGDHEKGIELIQNLWKNKGIDPSEINIVDGSGLSPTNRVTTHAQVSVLLLARNQPWYHGFLEALPEYNGMKMKSGTIHGVKGFCGYHRSGNGKEYAFSFLVNNYHGNASTLVQKMYRVLDVLK